MRVDATLYLLLTDHLGSSNVTYNTSTSTATTQRYYPWGTIRPGPDNALPTDYTFTGQKLDSATGLMYYGARWYDPALGRFVQADTIVPGPGDPQSLNRYSYVLNNPLRYIDPTGHFAEQELLDWGVFYGPNQMAGTRDGSDYYAEWYYMLRAAELGDTVSIRTSGSSYIEGQLELSNGGLLLTTGDGTSFGVGFDTLKCGDTFVTRLPGLSFTNADGLVLQGAKELRRFVQLRDHGYHNAGDFDYYSVSVGFFAGVGGVVTVRWDRYGRVYLGLSLGIGVGGLAVSAQGGHLVQDYVPDQGQVDAAVNGWGMSLQGGYGWGGGGVSVVNSGPVPFEVGLTTIGIAGTIGYTWEVR